MHSNSGFVKSNKPARFTHEEAQERIKAHKKKGSKRIAKQRDFEFEE